MNKLILITILSLGACGKNNATTTAGDGSNLGADITTLDCRLTEEETGIEFQAIYEYTYVEEWATDSYTIGCVARLDGEQVGAGAGDEWNAICQFDVGENTYSIENIDGLMVWENLDTSQSLFMTCTEI